MSETLRFRVEKLIRDKLPAIMRAQGLQVFERRLDDDAYIEALKTKLAEEAGEAAESRNRDELIGELADLAEVTRALMTAAGIDAAEVESARLAKRLERGGFEGRIYNAAVAAEAGAPALDYYLARPGQYQQAPE